MKITNTSANFRHVFVGLCLWMLFIVPVLLYAYLETVEFVTYIIHPSDPFLIRVYLEVSVHDIWKEITIDKIMNISPQALYGISIMTIICSLFYSALLKALWRKSRERAYVPIVRGIVAMCSLSVLVGPYAYLSHFSAYSVLEITAHISTIGFFILMLCLSIDVMTEKPNTTHAQLN